MNFTSHTLTCSLVSLIALSSALTITSSAMALQSGVSSRSPVLEGPANFAPTPDRRTRSTSTEPPAPTIVDSLGNVVDEPSRQLFRSESFDAADIAPGPVDRSRTDAPSEQSNAYTQPVPPSIQQRTRPLPSIRERYRFDQSEPPACQRPRQQFSQADYERALQRLALLERYLEQQLRYQAALEASAADYRDRVYAARVRRCPGEDRGWYENRHQPYGGSLDY